MTRSWKSTADPHGLQPEHELHHDCCPLATRTRPRVTVTWNEGGAATLGINQFAFSSHGRPPQCVAGIELAAN